MYKHTFLPSLSSRELRPAKGTGKSRPMSSSLWATRGMTSEPLVLLFFIIMVIIHIDNNTHNIKYTVLTTFKCTVQEDNKLHVNIIIIPILPRLAR